MAQAITRLCLREYLYAVLVNVSRGIEIRFGYDYYMYVHTRLSCAQLKKIVDKNKIVFRS